MVELQNKLHQQQGLQTAILERIRWCCQIWSDLLTCSKDGRKDRI